MDLHCVLIPAVNGLSGDEHFADSNALAKTVVREFRQFCIDQMTQRTEKRPEPPKDWKRNAKLNCDCADCQELATFLKNKDAKIHRFPLRKQLRDSVDQRASATCVRTVARDAAPQQGNPRFRHTQRDDPRMHASPHAFE